MGEPFLVTREPVTGPGIHPLLTRRLVTVQGEIHLWVQADDWALSAQDWTLTASADDLEMQRRLDVLAGQRLIAFDASPHGTTIRFEYGETLTIRPDPDPAVTSWTVFWRTRGHASWRSGGTLVTVPPAPPPP